MQPFAKAKSLKSSFINHCFFGYN